MTRPRPEPGVEYAGGPLSLQRQSHGEAVRSLAEFLGVPEERAAAMLDDGEAGAEIRSRLEVATDPASYGLGPLTGPQARRYTERRYKPPAG